VNLLPRIGTPFKWNGYVANQGNVDIPYLTVGVVLDQALDLTVTPPAEAFSFGTNAPDDRTFIAKDVPPGVALDFSFVVAPSGGQDFSYGLELDPESRQGYVAMVASDAEGAREYILSLTNPPALPADITAALGSTNAWGELIGGLLASTGLLDANDLVLWPAAPTNAARHLLVHPQPKDAKADCLTGCLDTGVLAKEKNMSDFLLNLEACGQDKACEAKAALEWRKAEARVQLDFNFCRDNCECGHYHCGTSSGGGASGSGVGLNPAQNPSGGSCGGPGGHTCPVTPRDPNELQGPLGYSTAAFAGVQQPWLYTIYFENVSNAAAYARQVLVTNKLDANFDLRTFRLQEIAFGNVMISVPTNRCFYQTRVALPPPHAANIVADVTAGVDVGNNLVFWTINAIDLNTGQLVESAQEGILPPNDASNSGQGHVTYTILPASGVATGTVITNQATIVFDINAPLDTNPTTNTVDAVPPTSTVAALPATVTDTNFTVAWFGPDDPAGSGVSSYDVYVSDNGGPWVVWLSNTTTNSATFSGQPGHYYYFYSRVWDNAGNVEPAPATFQAQTFVSANQPPTLQPQADHTAVVGTALVLTNAASDPDPGNRLTFSLLDAPAGAMIDPASGVIRWNPMPWQGRTTNLFTVTVTDNGLPPLSASQSFLVVVGDYLELDVGSADLLAGQSGCVPLRLMSTAPLTNLSFTLGIPPGQLSNLSVSPGVPQVAQAQLVPINASNAQIILSAGPGSVLSGTQTLASVCFDTSPAQPSFVAQLVPDEALAQASDGRSLTRFALLPGRLVVVATQPVIEAAAFGTNQLQLTLYGRPALRYSVESAADLRGPWSPVASLTLTNETQTISFPIQGTGARFFRLHQQ
jgi:hypothetical protein